MDSQIDPTAERNEKVIDYRYIRSLKNREVRRSRFKRTLSQRVFRLILVLLLLGELSYLSLHGARILQRSELFSLQYVDVVGAVHTDAVQIRTMLLSSFRNTWEVDLTKVQLQLEAQPWIQSAVVRRDLPGTIRVHIQERTPKALVLSGQFYLVDERGKVILTVNSHSPFVGLPVITGIEDVSDESKIRTGLEFISAVSEDQKILNWVSEFQYYDDHHSIIYLKGLPFGLFIAKNDILPVIRKFSGYTDFIQRNFPDLKFVDLRYKGQFILKNAYQERL